MITVQQAKEALETMYDYALKEDQGANSYASFLTLEEFIKQYEDWVKVKKVSALLKGKDE